MVSIIVFVIAVVSIFSLALNQQAEQAPSALTHTLAPLVNGQSIDTPETQSYLKANNYFADINYDVLPLDGRKDYVLTTGNRQDNIRGIEIQGQRYAIDLVFCHWGTQSCVFRINGINTQFLHAFENGKNNNSYHFMINSNFELKVNSIEFDKCDLQRFCHPYYDTHTSVQISMISK